MGLALLFQYNPLAAQPATAYFSTIHFMESPFEDFKGVVPLTRSQAANRNHYRFDYDEKNRLSRIGFYTGTRLRDPNFTANFFYLSAAIQFSYETGKEIRTFYNRFGEQIPVRGPVFREIYELDSMGRRKSLYFENRSGGKTQNSWNIASYKWAIQTDGSVIEERFNLQGTAMPMRTDQIFHRIKMHFDQNGMMVLMQNIGGDGSLLENNSGAAQDKLVFDNNRKYYGWTVLDKNHLPKEGNAPNVARGVNEPNEYGYYAKSYHLDKNGKRMPASYGYWGTGVEYDNKGNQSLVYFLDSLGNPGPHIREGLTYMRYSYDKAGINQVLTEFLDIDKKPFHHPMGGYASQKSSYDKKNRVIRVDYFGTDGKLINRSADGIASTLFEYDNRNRTTRIAHYNAEGKPENQRGSGVAWITFTFEDDTKPPAIKRFNKDGNQLK